uniref:LsmAD domain-containing protein n=1 Tax=Globodera pallida TaxID=36090 RepID=A0A183CBG4_GLOPA
MLIRARLLPVLANSDDGKDYCVGGKYAKSVAQLDAEYAEQARAAQAEKEEEERQKMAAFGIRNGHTATASDNGTFFAASAAGSSTGSANAESAAGTGTGNGGRGTGRLSYGGMRGVGRARGCSGR